MKNIALTGYMGSGKNTVADYLSANYGYTQIAFADALKRYAQELFPDQFYNGKPRELLQRFGQMMRELDPYVWINQLSERINQRSDVDRWVITDLRQPNECEYCRAKGFVIIRVNCPLQIRLERLRERGDNFDFDTLRHETESYVNTFDVDYEIDNSGLWRDMAEQVDVIMQEIKGESKW